MSVGCYPCLYSRVSYDLHLLRGIVSSTLLLFISNGAKGCSGAFGTGRQIDVNEKSIIVNSIVTVLYVSICQD